jgi:hypothetical protein
MYPNIVTAKTDPVTGGITLQAGGKTVGDVLDIRQFGDLSASSSNSSLFATVVAAAPVGSILGWRSCRRDDHQRQD